MIHIRLVYDPTTSRTGSGMYIGDYIVEVRDGISRTTEQMPLKAFLYETGPFPNQREIEIHIIKTLQSGNSEEIERLCMELDSRYRTMILRRQPTIKYVPIDSYAMHNCAETELTMKREISSVKDKDIYYLLTS